MDQTQERDLEQRIRARAHQLWEQEGRPDGRADSHWEQAKAIIALEDAHHQTLKPSEPPAPEPLIALENQGEFPTLTDQGEQVIPTRSRTR